MLPCVGRCQVQLRKFSGRVTAALSLGFEINPGLTAALKSLSDSTGHPITRRVITLTVVRSTEPRGMAMCVACLRKIPEPVPVSSPVKTY